MCKSSTLSTQTTLNTPHIPPVRDGSNHARSALGQVLGARSGAHFRIPVEPQIADSLAGCSLSSSTNGGRRCLDCNRRPRPLNHLGGSLPLTKHTWPRRPFSLATAGELSTPTASTFAPFSSGRPMRSSRFSMRRDRTSSSTAQRSRSGASSLRRLTGDCRRCAASTASPISMGEFRPTRLSTCDAQRCIGAKVGAWTAASSERSSSPPRGSIVITPHWRCSSD